MKNLFVMVKWGNETTSLCGSLGMMLRGLTSILKL